MLAGKFSVIDNVELKCMKWESKIFGNVGIRFSDRENSSANV